MQGLGVLVGWQRSSSHSRGQASQQGAGRWQGMRRGSLGFSEKGVASSVEKSNAIELNPKDKDSKLSWIGNDRLLIVLADAVEQ